MSTLSATVDLPVTAYTVRDARALTLALVAAWDSGVSREDLALLIDDLTADVVDHASAEASLVLELSLADELLRVGLVDGSAVRPVADDVTRLGGHWALAHRWGDEPYQNGHRVWFELLPPLPGPEAGGVVAGPADMAVFAAALTAAVGTIDGVVAEPAGVAPESGTT
ncbi:ATP-binding protein [Actinomycetospora cinnamomea]|uniref:Anti-sigma regulatory factor (Ser/Thr protein kinase) n=1 Tax=Actinomycetospora cinnamomea TaxID=663609 RepID=A0A2U1EBX8_9PSEU|nr:ATP-binding protein [Actinomycetospora cinnamomea]PVY97466.1 hypothetical protein C8D89_1243 [Actinomycetospora cinnamomea]